MALSGVPAAAPLIPGAPALVTSAGESLSYPALHAAIARATAALGPLDGRPVAVAVPSPAGYVVAALGVLAAGGVVVPLPARAGERGAEVARRAGADRVVESATFEGHLDLATVPGAAARRLDPRAGLVLATSGSSGTPRLVLLGRAGLEANVGAILDYLPVRSHPRTAVVLPLHYSYALVGQAFTTLAAGGTLLLLGDVPFPARQVEAMARLGAGGLSSVPASLRLLAEAAAALPPAERPPLGYVASAGAPLTAPVVDAVRAAFPAARLWNQYGLTEASPRVAALSDADPAFAAGAVGRPLAGIEITVRRPDGSPCAPGETGEIHVRGPSVMLAYLDDPEATRRALGPHGLRTGDRGYLDPDGRLYVTGRADDQVKVAGERVTLGAVAAALAALDGVDDAAVVALPDRWTGARLAAAVVLAPGADLGAVRRSARGRLAPAWRPTRWRTVESLPLTPRGKLDRAAVRALFSPPTEGGADERP